MSRKLIAIDLDGTLLDSTERVSTASQAYLQHLHQSDQYIITIASGRIHSSVLYATDGARFAGYIMTDSGARIYDSATNTKVINHYLDHAILAQVLACPEAWLSHLDACDEDYYWKYCPDPDYHQTNGFCSRIVHQKTDLLEQCGEIGHINLTPRTRHDQAELTTWLNGLNLPGVRIITMQDSGRDKQWLELLPADVDKYQTLKELADRLGIDNRDIIAFGDGLNDLELLSKCGTGVAMANALPAVKAATATVTDLDNDHDGVIDYLRKHL